ncbi:MAG: glycosyltransferase family 2 protein [Muribaculaceae bacterium]|nr:glycosyltransferase family 2 protein [Muribaculaceae bacterium]
MKKLGVIILNWNGLGLLKKYLPDAVRHTISESADLIVADNGSTDGSVEWVRSAYPEVKIIRFDENFGFAEGYNRAIRQADYPFVTLLNSDVRVTQGWWQPIVSFMERHPEAGAVQPKILSDRNPSLFEYAGAAGGYLDRLGYPFCRGRLFDHCEEDRGQYDTPPTEVAWASGACLTMPRDLYLKLGGLDPKFFAHQEEIDLCWRVIRSGKKVYALSDSVVYHLGGGSLPKDNPKKTYLNFRNNLLLLHKNLPRARGRRLTFVRRLADTLAWGMFLLKGDFKNANAIVKAHRDFSRMAREYTDLPADDTLSCIPGTKKYAVISRYLLRKKSI